MVNVPNDSWREYLRSGRSSVCLLSRQAAQDACMQLAKEGFQLTGLDGGRYQDGKFQPDLQTAWTKPMTSTTVEAAEQINREALHSINEDGDEVNAYALTTASVSSDNELRSKSNAADV